MALFGGMVATEFLSRYSCGPDAYSVVLESGERYDCPLCGRPLVQSPGPDANAVPNVNGPVLEKDGRARRILKVR